jgi:hypothetical protein
VEHMTKMRNVLVCRILIVISADITAFEKSKRTQESNTEMDFK